MPRREPGLQMIAVEMHFAHADRHGYLSPLKMTLRIPLPLRMALHEVESIEYNTDGTIAKIERGSLDQLISVLQEAREKKVDNS